jgi:hypothetical protein
MASDKSLWLAFVDKVITPKDMRRRKGKEFHQPLRGKFFGSLVRVERGRGLMGWNLLWIRANDQSTI